MNAYLRLSLLILALIGFATVAGAADKSPTVVELYTSQGCSSCPPADANLTRLTERDDIIALGFHVDYWDYIGWKDPFASPAFTQRQRDYAAMMGARHIYTPQMVIQGTSEVVGSNAPAVEHAIEKAKSLPRVNPTLTYDRAAGTVTVSVPAADTMENHSVLLVLYDDHHVTNVERGENGGQSLRYSHVVRDLRSIASWNGKALEVPVKLSSAPKTDACAVLLQSNETGRILGAATIDMAAATN